MNFAQLDSLMQVLLFTPGRKGIGLNMCFWGPPGGSKTSFIEQVAARYAMPCEVLSPGERGEGAFGVVPVPLKGNDGVTRLHYPAPEWVSNLADPSKGGVVFVDEVNTAAPALQPALLGLLNERRIGGSYVGGHVRLLAAANPTGQSGGYDLPPAVANRMGHLDWPAIDQAAWCAWMLSGASLDVPEGAVRAEAMNDLTNRVRVGWDARFSEASGLVTAYVAANPSTLHKLPNDGDPQASRAWPSPRTWELATRAYAGSLLFGVAAEVRQALVRAYIGEAAAKGFAAYLKDLDLPNPSDLLDGKVTFKADPRRLDRTMAVYNSCCALVVRNFSDKAPGAKTLADSRLKAFGELLVTTSGTARDTLMPVARVLSKQGALMAHPAMGKVLDLIGPLQKAAGLRA